VDRFVREELPEFELDDAQIYLELYRNAYAKDARIACLFLAL